jgi:hypothetical protein
MPIFCRGFETVCTAAYILKKYLEDESFQRNLAFFNCAPARFSARHRAVLSVIADLSQLSGETRLIRPPYRV